MHAPLPEGETKTGFYRAAVFDSFLVKIVFKTVREKNGSIPDIESPFLDIILKFDSLGFLYISLSFHFSSSPFHLAMH